MPRGNIAWGCLPLSYCTRGDLGLGRVTHTYMYGDFARCGPEHVKVLGYTTSFRVEGKGEIHFTVADAPNCLTTNEVSLNATMSTP